MKIIKELRPGEYEPYYIMDDRTFIMELNTMSLD